MDSPKTAGVLNLERRFHDDTVFLKTAAGEIGFHEFLHNAWGRAHKLPRGVIGLIAEPTCACLELIVGAGLAACPIALLPRRASPVEIAVMTRIAGCTSGLAGEHNLGLYSACPIRCRPIHETEPSGDTGGIPLAVLTQPIHSPLILFTSGSTGTPKIVNHSWKTLTAHAGLVIAALEMTPRDTWLLNLPLNHVGGLGIFFRALCSGGAVTLPDRPEKGFDPAYLHDLIDSGAVTRLSMVPAMARMLLDVYPDMGFPDSLKTVLIGGAPLSRPLFEQLHRHEMPFRVTYGLTEAGSMVTCTANRPHDPDSSGHPLAGIDVRITDETGQELPPGVPGRIAVSSPGLCIRDAADERARRDGDFLVTSDRGFLDLSGALHVTGRFDRMFISGGENVFPEEIESAVRRLPTVADARVFTEPHPVWGQRPILQVVLHPGSQIDETDLRQALLKELPRFKVPETIRIVAELPPNVKLL